MIKFADEKDSKDRKISQETLAEIRNALTIISGFAQLQLTKAKPDMIPDTRKQLQETIHQVDRVDRLLPK